MRTYSNPILTATGAGRRDVAMRGGTAILAVLLAASWLPLRAAATGSLSGTVSNPAGAAAPGVTVLVQNEATKEILSAKTKADGVYAFSVLPEGSYELRIEQRIFGLVTGRRLADAGRRPKMDIRLNRPRPGNGAGATQALHQQPADYQRRVSDGYLLARHATGRRLGGRGLSRLGISLNLSRPARRRQFSGWSNAALMMVYPGLPSVGHPARSIGTGTFNGSALQIHDAT